MAAVRFDQANIKSIQVLGDDSLSLSPRTTGKFTVPYGTTYTLDKALDQDLVIRGGVLFTQTGIVGDSLKVQVIDKDDVLGLGATPENPIVLAEYVKEWSVMPGVPNELIDVSISEPLAQGLYVRIIYASTSQAQDADVIVNLIAYEGTPSG